MYVIFDYDVEKWISGFRKNAILLVRCKYDAFWFPSKEIAEQFICVLKALFPDLNLRALPFDEYF